MKERKQPRKVEIPEDSVLDFDTFEELRQHAFKSSTWYLGKFPAHSTKLRQRLFEKGYPDGETRYIDYDDEEKSQHIVDSVIAELKDLVMVDDEFYIQSKLRSGLYSGKGISLLARELKFKGVPEEELELAVEAIQDDIDMSIIDSVDKAAQKAMRASAYRKATNPWQRKMAVSRGLMAKGFDRDTIDEWMEANTTLLEEEN